MAADANTGHWHKPLAQALARVWHKPASGKRQASSITKFDSIVKVAIKAPPRAAGVALSVLPFGVELHGALLERGAAWGKARRRSSGPARSTTPWTSARWPRAWRAT